MSCISTSRAGGTSASRRTGTAASSRSERLPSPRSATSTASIQVPPCGGEPFSRAADRDLVPGSHEVLDLDVHVGVCVRIMLNLAVAPSPSIGGANRSLASRHGRARSPATERTSIRSLSLYLAVYAWALFFRSEGALMPSLV